MMKHNPLSTSSSPVARASTQPQSSMRALSIAETSRYSASLSPSNETSKHTSSHHQPRRLNFQMIRNAEYKVHSPLGIKHSEHVPYSWSSASLSDMDEDDDS